MANSPVLSDIQSLAARCVEMGSPEMQADFLAKFGRSAADFVELPVDQLQTHLEQWQAAQQKLPYAWGHWNHLFTDNSRQETLCRIVVDVNAAKLIAAQEKDGLSFVDIRGDRFSDLEESVIEANEAHTCPADLGLLPCAEIPGWAQDVQAVVELRKSLIVKQVIDDGQRQLKNADNGCDAALAALDKEKIKVAEIDHSVEGSTLDGTHLIEWIVDGCAAVALDVEVYETEDNRPWIQIYNGVIKPESSHDDYKKMIIELNKHFDIYSEVYPFPDIAKLFVSIGGKPMDGAYVIDKEAARQPDVHNFAGRNSSDVYDITQTDSAIKDGDVLDFGDGNVGIQIGAWPTVFTGQIEHFHEIQSGVKFEDFRGGKYLASVVLAKEVVSQSLEGKKQSVETDGPAMGM